MAILSTLFKARDFSHGYELWGTGGTASTTYLVDDINPGAAGSNPGDLIEFTTGLGPFPAPNGQVLFGADDGVTGTELWISDGTASGTSEVKDINPGPGSSDPADLTVLLPRGGFLGGGSAKAVFAANDGTTGTELWVTNG